MFKLTAVTTLGILAVSSLALTLLGAPPAEATERGGDYCRYGQSSSLFLIDRTTPYDEVDRRAVINGISAVIEGLAPGDRITIATIGSTTAYRNA